MSYTPFVSADQVNAATLAARFDAVDSLLSGIASAIPSGGVIAVSQVTAPTGYLLCDGSAVSRATYAALFSAIGTTFGAGDGLTTFNLPEMRGRAVIGVGAGSGLTARTLGQSLGAETHLLATTELPSHTHTVSGQTTTTAGSAAGALEAVNGGGATGAAGGTTAHNNMQPSLALTWVIKT